jgi:hypothetical protein
VVLIYTITKSSRNAICILYARLNHISYILIKRVFNNEVI